MKKGEHHDSSDGVEEGVRRSIRLERGLTYAAMATLIGISVPMILKYERGFSFPSVETLIDLCKELEVGADALLGLNVYEIKTRPR